MKISFCRDFLLFAFCALWTSNLFSQPNTAQGLSLRGGLGYQHSTIGHSLSSTDYTFNPTYEVFDPRKDVSAAHLILSGQFEYKKYGIRCNAVNVGQMVWLEFTRAVNENVISYQEWYAQNNDNVFFTGPEWEVWYKVKESQRLSTSLGFTKLNFRTRGSISYFPFGKIGKSIGPFAHFHYKFKRGWWGSLQGGRTLLFTKASPREGFINLLGYRLNSGIVNNYSFRQTHIQAQLGKGKWFGTFETRIVSHPQYKESPTTFFLGGGYTIPIWNPTKPKTP
jgi:hypothetical protein